MASKLKHLQDTYDDQIAVNDAKDALIAEIEAKMSEKDDLIDLLNEEHIGMQVEIERIGKEAADDRIFFESLIHVWRQKMEHFQLEMESMLLQVSSRLAWFAANIHHEFKKILELSKREIKEHSF